MNAGNGKDYSKTLIRVTFLFKDGTRKFNLKLKLNTICERLCVTKYDSDRFIGLVDLDV
jgi:hypothetical protein